jgi:hypothetical protein
MVIKIVMDIDAGGPQFNIIAESRFENEFFTPFQSATLDRKSISSVVADFRINCIDVSFLFAGSKKA